MADILIVDDDDAVRGSLARVLTRLGHTVREAPDGLRGVKAMEVAPADLVITDMVMPEQEGIETITDIRERWPDTRILAISGAGTGAWSPLDDARLMGADGILGKPVDVEVLEAEVNRLLRERRP